eukprot:CAMPEP_0172032256 /NCGR_PEP_ID=MMETSP1041-20130122/19769_1 /TAXON_ID=464988 /ORGANISM="Hemiselmis andersenii, Strain CCMP439" /LENGTH=60 /DNA_ID=CAMNT_0012688877 /DNA_START=116 /DNA_END=298 /DNA_ORIENTATION=+
MLRMLGFSPSTIHPTGTLTTTEMAPNGEMREGLANVYATRFPASPRIMSNVPAHQVGMRR